MDVFMSVCRFVYDKIAYVCITCAHGSKVFVSICVVCTVECYSCMSIYFWVLCTGVGVERSMPKFGAFCVFISKLCCVVMFGYWAKRLCICISVRVVMLCIVVWAVGDGSWCGCLYVTCVGASVLVCGGWWYDLWRVGVYMYGMWVISWTVWMCVKGYIW